MENELRMEFFNKKKTNLVLSKNGQFIFDKDFSIEFDYSIHKISNYGPVFTANSNDKIIFNLIYSFHQDKDSVYLTFLYEDQVISIFKIKKSEIIKSKWYKFILNYSFSKNILEVSLGEKFVKKNIYSKKDKLNFDLVFGDNELHWDCPRIAVRDIKIIDTQLKELLHYWPLDEADGNIAHDIIGDQDGVFNSGIWLKGNSFKWNLLASFKNKDGFGKAYNAKENQVYLITKDSIIKYNINNNEFKVLQTNHYPKLPYVTFIIDTIKNIMYGISDGAKGDIDIYDEKKNYWQTSPIIPEDSGRYYSSRYFYNAEKDTIYSLGGYGWYSFKNTLQYYDLINKKWNIIPTYGDFLLPGIGYSVIPTGNKNKYYIFGSFGNPVGDQSFGSYHYFNLYHFDLDNRFVKKVYSGPKDIYSFTHPTDIYFPESGFFYILKEQKKIRYSIAGISLDKPMLEVFSDTLCIFNGHIILGDVNIYYDKINKEFVVIAPYKELKTGNYVTAIMSLSYPPITKEEYTILAAVSKNEKEIPIWAYILGISVYGIITLVVFFNAGIIKMPKKLVAKSKSGNNRMPIPQVNNITKPVRISTFGEFNIYFHDQEISRSFSLQQKELFLLLLLNNFRYNNHLGISTTELTDILWPHLDKIGSKNSRGVLFNQMRKKLAAVPDIKIITENSKWYLDLSENVECDFQKYVEFKGLNNGEFSDNDISIFNQLIKNGKFLKQVDYGWLDSIKSQVIFDVTTKLYKIAKIKYMDGDFETLLETANNILIWDPVDEFGSICKIQALSALGRHALAKEDYNLFRSLYHEMYNTSYNKSFETVLAENIINFYKI